MPRKAERRKLPSEENADAPRAKQQRVLFELPVPQRSEITGRVLVCGQGDMGQLGLGNDDSKFERKRPALVEPLKNVVDVCAGGMHNLVLTNEGKVYSFGCNDEGALGRDSSNEGSEFEPLAVDLPGRVVKISGGDSHSACLLEDGRVFAWGSFRDSHGNMGLTLEGNKRLPIDVLPSIQCCDISSGADHLVILTCSGKVFTVGCGEQGQLGRVSLRSASGESRRGKTELLRPALVTVKRVKTIDAVWATNYCTYVRDAQTKDVWAFGLNNYKQLAYEKDKDLVITPILTDLRDVRQIAGGQHHTLVLKEDGTCYVIGRHDYGRLGLGEVKEDLKKLMQVGGKLQGKRIVRIACGEAQSFALTAEGQLFSWGMGSNLQLGTGSEDDSTEPELIVSKQTEGKSIIQVSSGGQHSIFLVKDDVQPKSTKSTKAPAVTEKNGAVAETDNATTDDAKATKGVKNAAKKAAPVPEKAGKVVANKANNGTDSPQAVENDAKEQPDDDSGSVNNNTEAPPTKRSRKKK